MTSDAGDLPPDPHFREPATRSVSATPRQLPAPPPPPAEEFDAERDRRSLPATKPEDINHVWLLSIFFFVVGAIVGLFACFPIFHFVIGLGLVTGSFPAAKGSGPPPPPALGWMFVIVSGSVMLMGWAVAIGLMAAGYQMRRHRGYVFCLVMAGLAMMFQPFGTVLGVFTIIVLLRPGVKRLFGRGVDPPGSALTASA